MRPNLSPTSFTMRSTSAFLLTSPCITSDCGESFCSSAFTSAALFSLERYTATTISPLFARARLMHLPIPRVPPVIIATLCSLIVPPRQIIILPEKTTDLAARYPLQINIFIQKMVI
ncbi:MAG: hypothetical protein DELT_03202 [Desulfovibrio sp.]